MERAPRLKNGTARQVEALQKSTSELRREIFQFGRREIWQNFHRYVTDLQEIDVKSVRIEMDRIIIRLQAGPFVAGCEGLPEL